MAGPFFVPLRLHKKPGFPHFRVGALHSAKPNASGGAPILCPNPQEFSTSEDSCKAAAHFANSPIN